jgi:hypothetical protein
MASAKPTVLTWPDRCRCRLACSNGVTGTWLLLSSLAHNLARWIARLGLDVAGPIVAQTIRRRYLTLPGRITRSARCSTLHLPARWPWREGFTQALERLHSISLLA